MSLAETIYEVIKPLPEDLAKEVLDFALYLTQRDENQNWRDLQAAQITSKAGHALTAPILNSDLAIGQLPKASYIRPDKLITLNLTLIQKRIAQLSPEATDKFDQLVCQTLQC